MTLSDDEIRSRFSALREADEALAPVIDRGRHGLPARKSIAAPALALAASIAVAVLITGLWPSGGSDADDPAILYASIVQEQEFMMDGFAIDCACIDTTQVPGVLEVDLDTTGGLVMDSLALPTYTLE